MEGLARALNTNTDDGLDASAAGDLSVARRQELYGANTFASVPTQSFWAILWDALSDKVLIVLMIAATVRSLSPTRCITVLLAVCSSQGWSLFADRCAARSLQQVLL